MKKKILFEEIVSRKNKKCFINIMKYNQDKLTPFEQTIILKKIKN